MKTSSITLLFILIIAHAIVLSNAWNFMKINRYNNVKSGDTNKEEGYTIYVSTFDGPETLEGYSQNNEHNKSDPVNEIKRIFTNSASTDAFIKNMDHHFVKKEN
uniref:Cathepsin propeptide inhibitor domain-containing protein n=1 Tax=Pectinophora gossypiella TaxID=13191 RepID=A0A1E1W3U0_PECGO